MKKSLMIFLCLLLLLPLNACGAKAVADDAETLYYVTKREMTHNTGDVDLTTYLYDENWNTVSIETRINNEFAYRVDYAYNQDGYDVTMTTTLALYDSSVSQLRNTYNEAGQLIRAVSYNDSTLTGITDYAYDDQGRQIRLCSTSPDGTPSVTKESTFDENGNLLTESTNSADSLTLDRHTYDQHNRRIATQTLQNGTLTSRIEYIWEGTICRGTVYTPSGMPLRTVVHEYDEAGNRLVEEYYDVFGALEYCTRYEYTSTDGTVSSGFPE